MLEKRRSRKQSNGPNKRTYWVNKHLDWYLMVISFGSHRPWNHQIIEWDPSWLVWISWAEDNHWSVRTHRTQQPGLRTYNSKSDAHNNVINILVRLDGWVVHMTFPEESRVRLIRRVMNTEHGVLVITNPILNPGNENANKKHLNVKQTELNWPLWKHGSSVRFNLFITSVTYLTERI